MRAGKIGQEYVPSDTTPHIHTYLSTYFQPIDTSRLVPDTHVAHGRLPRIPKSEPTD